MKEPLTQILVTGAGGFIGSALLRVLARRGFAVDAVGRSQTSGVAWHSADLLKPSDVSSLIETTRPAVVIHLAWETKHPEFWSAPSNVDWVASTLHLARSFAEHGGRRFIGLGSAAEYSWLGGQTGALDEASSPREPTTLYGAAKNATNDLLSAFFARSGIEFAWGRLFHPYGPGEDRATLVPSVIKSLLAGEPALCTAGSPQRDFIYIDDVAEAMAALAESSQVGAFNIGSANGVAVADAVTMIGSEIGRPELVRLGALPSRSDDPPRITARIDRIRDRIGWSPRVSLNEGIRETVRWWRERGGGA